MSHIVLLEKTKHAGLNYRSLTDFSFARNQRLVPLLPGEVAEASRCFPIVFARPGSAQPFALLGLGDVNVFVGAKGRWTAPYLPLLLENYPFSLAEVRRSGEGEEAGDGGRDAATAMEMAIAIDEDAPHFRGRGGKPLYTPEGDPSEVLQRVIAALGRQFGNYQAMRERLAELALSPVLEERHIVLSFGGREHTVSGLRVANREKLMAYKDETLAAWVRNGVMELLYAHWDSLRHLRTLMEHPSCPADAKAPVQ